MTVFMCFSGIFSKNYTKEIGGSYESHRTPGLTNYSCVKRNDTEQDPQFIKVGVSYESHRTHG
jgi:hypothetical protein